MWTDPENVWAPDSHLGYINRFNSCNPETYLLPFSHHATSWQHLGEHLAATHFHNQGQNSSLFSAHTTGVNFLDHRISKISY